ncbi:MAG: hypothetical protein RMZ41_031545 [Nostoc sp. DedVER02]
MSDSANYWFCSINAIAQLFTTDYDVQLNNCYCEWNEAIPKALPLLYSTCNEISQVIWRT